ncbi:MAG: hypothetical protein Fues2KO_19210 [Fuerstiella sp.]
MRSQTPPLILALAACIVFTVLIVTGLGIRLLILREATGPNPEFEAAARVTVPENLPPESAEAESLADLTDAELPAMPDDSALEVLPPPAAKKKGRQLPGVLYVGDNLDMFGQLHEALLAMIPGDIIEIRTNRILDVAPVTIPEFADSSTAPVMIRAAAGFYPVLRQTVEQPTIKINNRTIWLKGLHFTGRRKWFFGNNLTIAAQSCSWTKTQVTGGDDKSKLNRVFVDRCIFRSSNLGGHCGGHIGLYRSFFVGDGQSKVWLNNSNQLLEVRHCTFIHNVLVTIVPEPSKGDGIHFSFRDSVFLALACCPRLLIVKIDKFDESITPLVAKSLLKKCVKTFELHNNYLHFHHVNGPEEGWGGVVDYQNGRGISFKANEFPDVQSQLKFTHGSPNVGQMNDLAWSQDPERFQKIDAVVRQLTWQDAILTLSKEPAVDARLRKREVGCIPELLPAIPPEAGEPYELRPADPP